MIRPCFQRTDASGAITGGLPVDGRDGSNDEVTCYAESVDGITFTKPNLGLFEVRARAPITSSRWGSSLFAQLLPFLDAHPNVPHPSASGAGRHDGQRPARIHPPDGDPLAPHLRHSSRHARRLRLPKTSPSGRKSSTAMCCISAPGPTAISKGYRTISRATSTNFPRLTDPCP